MKNQRSIFELSKKIGGDVAYWDTIKMCLGASNIMNWCVCSLDYYKENQQQMFMKETMKIGEEELKSYLLLYEGDDAYLKYDCAEVKTNIRLEDIPNKMEEREEYKAQELSIRNLPNSHPKLLLTSILKIKQDCDYYAKSPYKTEIFMDILRKMNWSTYEYETSRKLRPTTIPLMILKNGPYGKNYCSTLAIIKQVKKDFKIW